MGGIYDVWRPSLKGLSSLEDSRPSVQSTNPSNGGKRSSWFPTVPSLSNALNCCQPRCWVARSQCTAIETRRMVQAQNEGAQGGETLNEAGCLQWLWTWNRIELRSKSCSPENPRTCTAYLQSIGWSDLCGYGVLLLALTLIVDRGRPLIGSNERFDIEPSDVSNRFTNVR